MTDKDAPLPPGALARPGSTRWRHGGMIIGSALAADGKRLATASVASVAVWDLPSGNVPFRFHVGPGGRQLATKRYTTAFHVNVASSKAGRLGPAVRASRFA